VTQYAGWINSQWVYGNLGWNANGSLSSLATFDPFNSAVNNQTCNYVYDDLARLASDNCGSAWSQTFSYDPFGNITKSGSISWMPGYNSAMNHYTLGGTAYDNDGNLTADTFHSYAWNADSQPGTIDATQLTYDAQGRVVEMNNTGTITDFVYTPSGRRFAYYVNGSFVGFTVDLPGGLRAGGQTSGAGVQFYSHPDWLGSARTVSSTGRTWVGSEAYAPFGEPYSASGSPQSLFTNQYNDEASDLYDFPAREQHRLQGRWISPDPAGLAAADPSNPQTWNRYAYVGNNPLNTIDPLGLRDWTFFDAIGSQSGCGATPGDYCYYVNGIQVSAAVAASLINMGVVAGVLPNNCSPGGCFSNGAVIPIQQLGNGQFGGCGQSGWSYFCIEFAPAPVDAANNGWTWAWDFTKSFFGGFTLDTSSGSCLAVALDSYKPVVNAFKKTRDYTKDYVAPIVTSLPGAGASIANGLYSTVQYGADRGNALEMGGAVSATATFLAAQGQRAVSAVASAARNPYVALTVADAALLWGVGNEAVAAYQGKCH
jgi:RHS repeat-associated protein